MRALRFSVLIASVVLIIVSATATDVYAQTTTYAFPAAGWPSSGPAPQVTTTVNSAGSGCSNYSTTFPTAENIYPPFWYARSYTPWFPGYGGVSPSFSLAPPANPLTVVNGLSQGQGTVTQTATVGTYPASLGTGVGASGTYTISIAGATITEQYDVNIEFVSTGIPPTETETYAIQSTYDVQSGIQTYSFNLVINQSSPGVNCVETQNVNETGSTSFNWQLGTGTGCTLKQADIFKYAGGPYSSNLLPETMNATFTPTDANGSQISLIAAAAACGFSGFNFYQTVTTDVHPPKDSAGVVLSVPYSDPPPPPVSPPGLPGGYLGHLDNAFPFFWNQVDLSQTVPCTQKTPDPPFAAPIESTNTLRFQDCPGEPLLLSTDPAMVFVTSLAGICGSGATATACKSVPFGFPAPLSTWTWQSTFNGTNTGGVSQRKSYFPTLPTSGTGGVSITSINGVTQNPPVATCVVSPNILWPPNRKSVSVTVSGQLTAGTSALTAESFSVIDSYDQIQPNGTLTLGAGGSFSFSIPLIASRNGSDPNGRTYTIYVAGRDTIGNVGICSAVVTVPHDQGNS
jgi:hypothetical protein